MSVYASPQDPPEDHIKSILASPDKPATPSSPSFGIDSPPGLLLSNVASPLYLYATLSGKHAFWRDLLSKLPDQAFVSPSLDIGCGRGAVLVKIAERKKALAIKSPDLHPQPAYGVDIFTTDQSGNSPAATYRNAAALKVLDFVVLNTADFTATLPFADGVFGLVTSSLSLHNASEPGRLNCVKEMARVCSPGGTIVLVDLHWVVVEHFTKYRDLLRDLGWSDIEVKFADLRMVFGILPCQVLRAVKPAAS